MLLHIIMEENFAADIYSIWFKEKQCRVGSGLRFHWTKYRSDCIYPDIGDIWVRPLFWWQTRHCWVQWFWWDSILWHLLQQPYSIRVASISETSSFRGQWCFLIGSTVQKLHLGSSWIACEPWQWGANMQSGSTSLQICPCWLSYNHWRGNDCAILRLRETHVKISHDSMFISLHKNFQLLTWTINTFKVATLHLTMVHAL